MDECMKESVGMVINMWLDFYLMLDRAGWITGQNTSRDAVKRLS
jgi:hypothetical protein